MWRIMITDADGKILEKTQVAGPEQAIAAWESAWDNQKYKGKRISMKLLEQSSVLLSHRFDLEEGIYGWLPKSAAYNFFSN